MYEMGAQAQTATIPRSTHCPAAPLLSLQAQRTVLKTWLVVTDALALGAAFLIAYWLRFELQVTTSPEVVPPIQFYRILAAALALVLIVVFVLFELEELSMAEIAQVLELPPGTVASRLRRARETFHREAKRARARAGSGGALP